MGGGGGQICVVFLRAPKGSPHLPLCASRLTRGCGRGRPRGWKGMGGGRDVCRSSACGRLLLHDDRDLAGASGMTHNQRPPSHNETEGNQAHASRKIIGLRPPHRPKMAFGIICWSIPTQPLKRLRGRFPTPGHPHTPPTATVSEARCDKTCLDRNACVPFKSRIL